MLRASILFSAKHLHNFLMLRLGHGIRAEWIDDMQLKWEDQEENK